MQELHCEDREPCMFNKIMIHKPFSHRDCATNYGVKKTLEFSTIIYLHKITQSRCSATLVCDFIQHTGIAESEA